MLVPAGSCWSSDEQSPTYAYYIFVGGNGSAVGYDPKTDVRQIRCIK